MLRGTPKANVPARSLSRRSHQNLGYSSSTNSETVLRMHLGLLGSSTAERSLQVRAGGIVDKQECLLVSVLAVTWLQIPAQASGLLCRCLSLCLEFSCLCWDVSEEGEKIWPKKSQVGSLFTCFWNEWNESPQIFFFYEKKRYLFFTLYAKKHLFYRIFIALFWWLRFECVWQRPRFGLSWPSSSGTAAKLGLG